MRGGPRPALVRHSAPLPVWRPLAVLDERTRQDYIVSAVPVEQLRAAIRLLWPDEITPAAKRLLEQICDEHDPTASGTYPLSDLESGEGVNL